MSPRGRAAKRPTVDLVEFARVGGELSGSHPPSALPRLRELLFDDAGRIDWALRGERRPRPEGGSESYLALRLGGSVVVQCNRCLQGVECELADDRQFKVVATESQAERFDAETDEFDALVADPRFDVLELVEDEAILALPISPRHAECALPRESAPGDEPAPAERPNPFAMLAALRKPPTDGGSDA